MTVLVAGEALVDRVGAETHLGGGPFNTARTLGRLEAPVAYLGRVSTDEHGQAIAAALAADGVALGAVVRTADPTTEAIAELDASGAATYRFRTDGTSAVGLTAGDALAAVPDGVEVLHVGTLGLVFEPVAGAMEALVERLAGRALVMVDPNCRPAAIAAAGEAGYRARLGRVLAAADVVKVSDDDLAWLDPERPALEAARALLADGPRVVLLTRGAEGAVVVTRGGEEPVRVAARRIVDTIGAGDAFGGGFLAAWGERGAAALEDGGAVVEAARSAALVAARTCERAGASPPSRAELSP